MRLSKVTILVKDQDAALSWYTEKLGFEKRADEAFGPGMRWVTVAAPDDADLEIVLLKAEPAREAQVGQGTTWVLETNDCRGDYERLRGRGVEFTSAPSEMPWGVSAVFRDLYGNSFNLVQPSA